MTSPASWSNAWVTAVAGRPERRASLSLLGLSQNLQFVKSNDQQCVYDSISNPFYTFFAHLFSARRNSKTTRCLPRISLYHAILTKPWACARKFVWRHSSNYRDIQN
jgi:hypothetical protein